MSQNGVLIILPTKPELRQLPKLLHMAAKHVQKVLYLDFNLNASSREDTAQQKTSSLAEIYGILEGVFIKSTLETAGMDVRVLLENNKLNTKVERRHLSQAIDVALLHSSFQNIPGIVDIVHKRYNFTSVSSNNLQFLNTDEEPGALELTCSEHRELKTYNTVAVGGTFDRIHNGHRLLLSTCCLLTNHRIVVGVSDEPLLVNKTLGELIAPLEQRMKNIKEFIDDIKPGLVKEIVPLSDPAGPTKSDPDIQCLVISSETLKGGQAVNQIRNDAGLPEMDLFSIDLVGDQNQEDSSLSNDEAKMSSTKGRQHDLGKLLQPVAHRPNAGTSNIYIIGLTGGIASGKSSIAKRLEKLGAEIVDADKLGHSVYKLGTETYEEIVKSFGSEILNTDLTINRQRLGGIVFSDREQLSTLNMIVWPNIMVKIQEKIADAETRGSRVCIIEAALLLEAGWDTLVDEVWVSIIPSSEAVRRLKERNGLTEDEAQKRLGSQMENSEKVHRANVVLSTLWEPEYTQKQVEKAWDGLLERIQQA